MSDRRRPETRTQDLRARLRAAELRLEAELAEAAFRLREEIAEQREKTVMEKALAPHFGGNLAAEKSYRRWLSLPTTQRELKLKIRELEMKGCRSVADRSRLLRLRGLLIEAAR